MVPHRAVKVSAGMIVVRAVATGPKQPSKKTLEGQKTVPPRVAPEPSQASYQVFKFLVLGKICKKELHLGQEGHEINSVSD